MSNVALNSDASVEEIGPLEPTIPALFITMSNLPNVVTASSMSSFTSFSSVTSQYLKAALSPISDDSSSPSSLWISLMMTNAPSSVNLSTVAFPIPDAAPVMTATFPLQPHNPPFSPFCGLICPTLCHAKTAANNSAAVPIQE